MVHYLFTNDLRISGLIEHIKEAAESILKEKPLDKSQNNNTNTLKFYFNLQKGSKTINLAINDTKECIRNFILKFQFPNPRTTDSYRQSKEDGIMLAPYRIITRILFFMDLYQNITESYLTLDEILFFVFSKEETYANNEINYEALINEILENRENNGNFKYEFNNIAWKQMERQCRELVNILPLSCNAFTLKSGKLIFDKRKIKVIDGDISFIISLITYNKYWSDEIDNGESLEISYAKYLDVDTSNSSNIIVEQHNSLKKTIKYELSNFIFALRTKPFLILAGISGTGKSRIVREFAYSSCPVRLRGEHGTAPQNYCMIEVKPNWHDSTELLGYYSSIDGHYRASTFDRFVLNAWVNYQTDPKVPFFVCLDEMNLAPVEQYFAEFLSVLETRTNNNGDIYSDPLIKADDLFRTNEINTDSGLSHDGEVESEDITNIKYDYIRTELGLKNDYDSNFILSELLKKGLTLPPNLFIIGTVNMDDTTYQFSRKVIDRAMTIEMNGGNLEDMYKDNDDLTYKEDDGIVDLDYFAPKYTSANEVLKEYPNYYDKIVGENDKDGNIINGLPSKLKRINYYLKDTPFKVSYRVLNEMTIYLGVLLDDSKNNNIEITNDKFEELIKSTVDNIMLMKILPRIEGDEDVFKVNEGKNKLEQLKDLCKDNYEKSFAKLDEMCKRLDNTGFTRFWP